MLSLIPDKIKKCFIPKIFDYLSFYTTEGQPVLLNLGSVNSSQSEKYPESLGEYQLLKNISHNGHPVYQSLAREDRTVR